MSTGFKVDRAVRSPEYTPSIESSGNLVFGRKGLCSDQTEKKLKGSTLVPDDRITCFTKPTERVYRPFCILQ